LCFFVFYFGIKGFIGITAKGGYYNAFLDEHANFVVWYRNFLFTGTKIILQTFGYTANVLSEFVIQINGSNKVVLIYSCLGYGVISFWIAFVISNEGSLLNKMLWIIGGITAFSVLNMCRIAIILIANYKNYTPALPIDHHALFNICSYILIGFFMYVYARSINIKEFVNRRSQ
jgi:exosortase/archaeosortase family protein